ncbi:MAG TPA: hypothetical protein VF377_15905 [Acidimicrobiia bacterium]|jgi:hypothetical protein
MDVIMNVVMVAAAVVAGVVFLAVGVYSVVSLLVGDLLERAEPAERNFSQAA